MQSSKIGIFYIQGLQYSHGKETMTTAEIANYIVELNRTYQTGNATEHSYRPALQRFLENILKAKKLPKLDALQITNEPKRIDCGAPDYIAARNDIPVGYIEAKDIGIDLNSKANKEQFDRYKQTLNNIIFTDYLDFHFYRNGEFKESIRIGEVKGDKIVPIKDSADKFNILIMQFGNSEAQSITSPNELAKIMAVKARMMARIIESVLSKSDDDCALAEQMAAFKKVLIHDITPKIFADVYAQTIAYGMFVARLRHKGPHGFSRDEAAKLIPKTNPFLRQLFNNITGINLDERICWIVDDLAEAFKVTDVQMVMAGFGEDTQQTDPMIHFYEDFLSAYDPALRKSRGVWYTPQAVVNFIVRAVDEILQKEFNLPKGLADTSKIKIKIKEDKKDENGNDKTVETIKEVHKVQILDPAAGTGTFLAETVNQIYAKFKKQAGMWQGYVEEHLIPRLNGFELLMAPYTMAHVKLDWLLTQTGFETTGDQRLRVYLTNSLEKHHLETGTPFAQFLAKEANEANGIKRDTPVMVVLGNPPYSGESQNKSDWIMELMGDYKKEPNSELPLQERNSKWINDDYCKFIRLGQFFVDKNSEGILAYINNHSFIDNPTFRGMRWNLMKSFHKIYIIDLHGNAKKKEVCPDGSKDENVFDIQQGVSINIFVKTGRKEKDALAEVYHFDLYGNREEKYDYLSDNNFPKIPFTKLKPSTPEYFFVPKDYGVKGEYEKGFRIQELFMVNSVGIVTAKDAIFVNDKKDELLKNIKEHFNIIPNESLVQRINYRPFDDQFVYYDTGMIERAREKVMLHFLKGENVGLVVSKRNRQISTGYVSVTSKIADFHILDNAQDSTSVFPLYLYPETNNCFDEKRRPNLNETIVNEISQRTELRFTEKDDDEEEEEKNYSHLEKYRSSSTVFAVSEKRAPFKYGVFSPIDIFDYIYAVLHSPAYREKYKEFLKIDFPRIPYPETAKQFRKLAKLGEKLRRLHLMENVEPKQGVANYPISGSNDVDKPYYDGNRVYINSAQYFDKVPQEAWEFYIGGYQPAQKWLKDRRGRKLEFEDIEHYQKIVLVLRETGRVMREIEGVGL